ncbi:MAG TPA: BPL-N domain-containing protein [Spirochaetia bacterium]|nr:BPL-N domain-containing protein [Spirochaetia bacterium]
MQLLSLERLGAANRQTSFVSAFNWVNGLIKHGIPVYQSIYNIFIETSRYPEGHIFPAGTLLLDTDEDQPTNLVIDGISKFELVASSFRKLALPNRIGIYNGLNSAPFCFDPYKKLLDTYGIAATELRDQDIREGALEKCDLLIVPGGPDAGESYYAGLGQKGMDAIAQFLVKGGTFLGSCAGAYLPLTPRSDSPEDRMWLNVVPATDLSGLDYWRTGAGFVRISLEIADHPAAFGLAYGHPSTIDVIYWEGPVFHTTSDNIRVLARFREFLSSGAQKPECPLSGNQCATDCLAWSNPLTRKRFNEHMKDLPAAIEASWGDGRLILFSFHPEFGSPYSAWGGSVTHLFVINSIYDLST